MAGMKGERLTTRAYFYRRIGLACQLPGETFAMSDLIARDSHLTQLSKGCLPHVHLTNLEAAVSLLPRDHLVCQCRDMWIRWTAIFEILPTCFHSVAEGPVEMNVGMPFSPCKVGKSNLVDPVLQSYQRPLPAPTPQSTTLFTFHFDPSLFLTCSRTAHMAE